MPTPPIRILPVLAVLLCPLVGHALYRPGDIVDNFTLENRATGEPVELYDFEGEVIFLDFFAVWCPYCLAAAPQIDAGIDSHFRGQTARGLDFRHIGLNLQADTARYRPLTDQFISENRIPLVLQDTSQTIRNQFIPGAQPVFVVINGIAGSASHAQWEVVYVETSFGSTQAPIAAMRTAINSVLPAPPPPPEIVDLTWLGTEGLSLRIEGDERDSIRLERSTDLANWTPLETPIPDDPATAMTIPATDLATWKFLRAGRSP